MTETTDERDGPRRAQRIAAAAIGTALVVILYYALDRARMAILHPSIDPTMVIAGERIEYFWRVMVCSVLSPVMFAALYRLMRGREERAIRLAHGGIAPVVIVACVLSVLFP